MLRDVFESLKCYLDHWLSCILDCIHVCVFLLSKNCFEKLARHLLNTSSIASYLSSFLSFFLSQSRQHLDTWRIDRESFWPFDSFLTLGGSIEPHILLLVFLFLDSFSTHCCEILKYSQVYEPYRSIVGQERGRTHRDLNERRKIKSNLNQTNPNLV